MAEELAADGTVATIRPAIRDGHKTLIAALAPDGTPLAAGRYLPANGTTEIGSVGTLPTARRQGLAAAVAAGLATHARDHWVNAAKAVSAVLDVSRSPSSLDKESTGLSRVWAVNVLGRCSPLKAMGG
ncbi:GNAT family N-acetyltransferase [Streptomyces sp. NPDC002889]|uniref:GNAT family N-acetyltransferase n=1 Tax=Streptomyces sp. NPDC002889 TaxID=3364669 RepID=UPI0036BEFFD6